MSATLRERFEQILRERFGVSEVPLPNGVLDALIAAVPQVTRAHLSKDSAGTAMTPTQQAQAIVDAWKTFLPSVKDIHHEEYLVKEVADALRTAAAETREALKKYLRHWDGCEIGYDEVGTETTGCTCGLDALLRQPEGR